MTAILTVKLDRVCSGMMRLLRHVLQGAATSFDDFETTLLP